MKEGKIPKSCLFVTGEIHLPCRFWYFKTFVRHCSKHKSLGLKARSAEQWNKMLCSECYYPVKLWCLIQIACIILTVECLFPTRSFHLMQHLKRIYSKTQKHLWSSWFLVLNLLHWRHGVHIPCSDVYFMNIMHSLSLRICIFKSPSAPESLKNRPSN